MNVRGVDRMRDVQEVQDEQQAKQAKPPPTGRMVTPESAPADRFPVPEWAPSAQPYDPAGKGQNEVELHLADAVRHLPLAERDRNGTAAGIIRDNIARCRAELDKIRGAKPTALQVSLSVLRAQDAWAKRAQEHVRGPEMVPWRQLKSLEEVDAALQREKQFLSTAGRFASVPERRAHEEYVEALEYLRDHPLTIGGGQPPKTRGEELHDLQRELFALGDRRGCSPTDTLESLRLRRDDLLNADKRKEEEDRAGWDYMGLDGHRGDLESQQRHEDEQFLKAINPGTTSGSIAANLAYAHGGDIHSMRRWGELGNNAEDLASSLAGVDPRNIGKKPGHEPVVPTKTRSTSHHAPTQAPRPSPTQPPRAPPIPASPSSSKVGPARRGGSRRPPAGRREPGATLASRRPPRSRAASGVTGGPA